MSPELGPPSGEHTDAESLRLTEAATRPFFDQARRGGLPRVLYHYTTWNGLRGILKDKCIWATDARYLNDSSELLYASEVVEDEARRALGQSKFESLRDHADREPGFLNILTSSERPFVACFCETQDLLSQWRGYQEANEVGYSLGIDLSSVAYAHHCIDRVIAKVMYEPERQREFVRATMAAWASEIECMVDEGLLDPDDRAFVARVFSPLRNALLYHQLSFKHSGFCEECEWRIIQIVDVGAELSAKAAQQLHDRAAELGSVLPADFFAHLDEVPRGQDDCERPPERFGLQVRHGRRGVIPYIEIDLTELNGRSPVRVSLREVMQGPTEDAELSREALELFLKAEGYSMTEVKASDVPLRRT